MLSRFPVFALLEATRERKKAARLGMVAGEDLRTGLGKPRFVLLFLFCGFCLAALLEVLLSLWPHVEEDDAARGGVEHIGIIAGGVE